MKKRILTFLAIFAILSLLTLAFTACGGDGAGENSGENAENGNTDTENGATDTEDGEEPEDGEPTADEKEIESVEYDADGNLVIKFKDGTVKVVAPPETEEHQHTYGEWQNYEGNDKVFCEKKLTFRTCSECKTIEWNQGSEDDHVFESVTIPATCAKDGYVSKVCKTCGKSEVVSTINASHSFKTEYSSDAVFHWFACDGCDGIKNKEEHTDDGSGACSVCKEKLLPTDGIAFELSEDGTYAIVMAYNGTEKSVRIPSEYKGVPVKAIFKEAFKEGYADAKISAIVIPDSVTEIGSLAFSGCGGLECVKMGDGVTDIGGYAFSSCSSLSEIKLGKGVVNIGVGAFAKCVSLSSVIMQDGVKTIGDKAFSGLGSLERIVIPDSVTEIGESAFSECSALSSVELGKGVTRIGAYAFYNDVKLSKITFGDKVAYVGEYAFLSTPSLLRTEYEYGNYIGDADNPYQILEEVTNKNLATYIINQKATAIASGVFDQCTRLTNINLHEGLLGVGDSAFESCSSLESITLPETLTYVGASAFGSCWGIKQDSLVIPDSVTFIGSYAFSGEFDSLTIGEGVEIISESAFNTAQIKILTIGSNVRVIKEWAFSGKDVLTSVIFLNPEGWAWCWDVESDSTDNIRESYTKEQIEDTAFAAKRLLETVGYGGWQRFD